jgi:organic radical activating enzyme
MHCPFCYEYFDREKLELPKIFRIIEVCKQNRFQRISVAGGDPLGYSNIESVLEYAEELNLEVDLDTNCLAYNSG